MTTPRPLTRDVRKSVPLGVKLAVALRMLGYGGADIDFDHDPALGLRDWDDMAGDFIPAQLDPNYIIIRSRAEHKAKTNGRKGDKRATSYGSDVHVMAKARRILVKESGHNEREPSKWPKGRKMQSRGFERRRK